MEMPVLEIERPVRAVVHLLGHGERRACNREHVRQPQLLKTPEREVRSTQEHMHKTSALWMELSCALPFHVSEDGCRSK